MKGLLVGGRRQSAKLERKNHLIWMLCFNHSLGMPLIGMLRKHERLLKVEALTAEGGGGVDWQHSLKNAHAKYL